MNKIILALDTKDLNKAINIGKSVKGKIFTIKLGLEFFNAHGRTGIKKFNEIGITNFNLIQNLYDMMLEDESLKPKTKATAIQIGKPANITKGLRALDFTNGVVEEVTDTEMLDGMSVVGLNGFDCEMASGASVAGIKKLRDKEIIKKDDKVVGILTGRQKEPLLPIDYHNDPANRFARPPKN